MKVFRGYEPLATRPLPVRMGRRRYELVDSDEEEEQDILKDLAQSYVATSQRKGEAKDFVSQIVNALEVGECEKLFPERLADGCLKILFEPIGVDGLEHIAAALSLNARISSLEFGINEIATSPRKPLANMVKLLKTNTSIKSLSIWGNALDDQAVIDLAAAIRINPGIQFLNLSSNEFGDRAAIALADCLEGKNGLLHLDLGSNNRISDESAITIADKLKSDDCSLHTLILSSTSLSNRGAIAIALSLSHNKSLIHLDVSCNDISEEGIAALIVEVERSSLQLISIHGNMINDQSKRIILQIIDSLKEQGKAIVIVFEHNDADLDDKMF